MNTNTQIFFNDVMTSRAFLSSPAWVYFNQLSTSVFGFVRKKIEELRPCRIVDIFVKNFKIIFNHFFGLEFFNINISKFINYFSTKFMLKIFTLIANFFVQTSKFLFQILTSLFGIWKRASPTMRF